MSKPKASWSFKNNIWYLYHHPNRANVASLQRKQFSSKWVGHADLNSVVCSNSSYTLIEHEDLAVLKQVAEKICDVKVDRIQA